MKQLLLVLALMIPGAAAAQSVVTGADVRGTLTDTTGGVLPGVTITVTNVENNQVRSAVTDQTGRYLVAALPPGRYELAAELSGFGIERRTLDLVLGQAAATDLTLAVVVRETVEVTDATPAIDPGRVAIASVVHQEEIERLPINGRSFISFAALTPGVSGTGDSIPGAATSGLSFLGQRPRANNLLVDGLDNNDREQGSALVSFSQDAVREFQVLTGNYAAEFGFATAGVVNIVTKNGTNELRGSVFAYHRNDGLNARDYFERFDTFGTAVEAEEAVFRLNQFGGVLGGPLRRNRTFAFGSFERYDSTASNVVTIDPVTAAALNSVGVPVATGAQPYEVGVTQLLLKLSHYWAPPHSTTFRAQYSRVNNENFGNERPGTSGRQTFGGIEARAHGAYQIKEDLAASVSQLDVVGRIVNDFNVQFANEDQDVLSLDPTCSGLCDQEIEGTPEVTVLGTAIAGGHQFLPNQQDVESDPGEGDGQPVGAQPPVQGRLRLHPARSGAAHSAELARRLLLRQPAGDPRTSAASDQRGRGDRAWPAAALHPGLRRQPQQLRAHRRRGVCARRLDPRRSSDGPRRRAVSVADVARCHDVGLGSRRDPLRVRIPHRSQ